MPTRNAKARWSGALKDGTGTLEVGTVSLHIDSSAAPSH